MRGVGGSAGMGTGTPSLAAGSLWLASAVIPHSLMPLAAVQSSPRLGLSMPHTSVPTAVPETTGIDE